MARASNTYVVISDGLPIASFTVKYEMENWICEKDCPNSWTIFRVKDGCRWGESPDVTEITENYKA